MDTNRGENLSANLEQCVPRDRTYCAHFVKTGAEQRCCPSNQRVSKPPP